jgi:tRNA(fMet)-specific endonuclease VapC
MYLLDTDTLSQLHTGDARLRERQERYDPSEVATTIITRIEILQGRFDFFLKAADGAQLLRAFAWLVRSEELLRSMTVLPVNEAAASEFDQLRRNRKLKKIGRPDLLIAAIALAHRATVVTRNLRHFSRSLVCTLRTGSTDGSVSRQGGRSRHALTRFRGRSPSAG